MKLVTFRTYDRMIHAGVVQEERVITLEYPTVLELLRDPAGLTKARKALEEPGEEHTLNEVILLPPIPDPPSVRDFYAFEQHVKSARALRGLGMIPEWYEVPIFYFTNNSEIYGHEQPVLYPTGSKELDFELEIACVIGREGKDFATSLGPWLVTPDELAAHRNGNGVSERYDMTMLARVNGREISRGNFRDIHYSFPQMIAWASQNARLRAGDVLGSGTVGTGCLMELQNIELSIQVQPWLQPGDQVELEIEGIGVLRNSIL